MNGAGLMQALAVAELSGSENLREIEHELLARYPTLPPCECGSYALRTEESKRFCYRCGAERVPATQREEE